MQRSLLETAPSRSRARGQQQAELWLGGRGVGYWNPGRFVLVLFVMIFGFFVCLQMSETIAHIDNVLKPVIKFSAGFVASC